MGVRILITGINGFVGCHLAELLSGKGYDVIGTRIDSSNLEIVTHSIPLDKIFVLDLRNRENIDELIKKTKPEIIYHLAGVSWVPASWKDPASTFEINLIGSICLFEAICRHIPSSLCVFISTGDFYDVSKTPDNAANEDSPLVPRNPYAISKMAVDLLGRQYFLSRNLRIIRLRPFNHIGPYQSESFVIPEFAKQIALSEKGLAKPLIKVGNLDAERDFTDVRDMVQAYEMAISKCKEGECYNISSQKAYKVRQLLEMLLSYSKAKIRIETDPAKYRPLEVTRLLGNSAKFRTAAGWAPRIPIEKTVEDVLNYWRKKVQNG